LCVGVDDTPNLSAKKIFAEKLFHYGFLRNQLFAYRLADRGSEAVAMTRDHALRKQSDADHLKRLSRTKQHTHGKPGSCVTVSRREQNQ
jgi:hypothetical protein